MTTVTFRMEGDRITGFDSTGHSGYAEAGADIAVVGSALFTAADAPAFARRIREIPVG